MQDIQGWNLQSLQLDPPKQIRQIASRVRTSKNTFLRGPVDWPWLTAAAKLPGSALHVGLAIHFQNGFKQTGTVKLSPSVCRGLGLMRHTVYRAVYELENAGLVAVVRKKGCSPTITLCEPDVT